MTPVAQRAERDPILGCRLTAKEHDVLRVLTVDEHAERRRFAAVLLPRASAAGGADGDNNLRRRLDVQQSTERTSSAGRLAGEPGEQPEENRHHRTLATATGICVSSARVAATPTLSASNPSSIVIG